MAKQNLVTFLNEDTHPFYESSDVCLIMMVSLPSYSYNFCNINYKSTHLYGVHIHTYKYKLSLINDTDKKHYKSTVIILIHQLKKYHNHILYLPYL